MPEHPEAKRSKEIRARGDAEYAERMKGKPTPTQEENDRHALGETITEHEDDGSGPDPFLQTRHMEAGKPAAPYQTRQATPGPRRT